MDLIDLRDVKTTSKNKDIDFSQQKSDFCIKNNDMNIIIAKRVRKIIVLDKKNLEKIKDLAKLALMLLTPS
jgi:hypothetical protein